MTGKSKRRLSVKRGDLHRLIFPGLPCLCFVLLAVFLVTAPKPWEAGIWGRLLEGEEKLHTRDFIVSGRWWGALAAAVLVSVIGLAHRWVRRRFEGELPRLLPGCPRRGIAGKVFLLAITLCVAFSAWQNLPRLFHSLWGDEEYTMRRYVVGEVRRDSSGGMVHRRPPWSSTLWDCRRPNNHVFFSVLSRTSHDMFAGEREDPEEMHFSAPAIRLPAFLAGLGAVACVVILLSLFGWRAAGLFAAVLLSLHPWFVRYAVDARGYALILLFTPLSVLCLFKAADSGRWRWWLAFGVAQFLTIYSFAGSLHFILVCQAGAALLVLFRPCAGRDRLVLIARWLTSGAVSVILVALFMTPCLLQIAEYTKSARSMEEAMDAAWMRDALSFIGTGLSWKRWDWGGNPLALSLKQSLQTSPFLTWATLIMLGTAIVAGTVRLVRSGLAGRVLAMILVLPAPLAFAHFSLKGNTLFHWYLVGSILSVAVLAAAGAAWVGALMAPARLRSHLPGIAFLLLGGGFATLTHGQRELYRTHPIEPLEESVRVTRNVINPLADGIDKVITIGFVMNTKGYDPAANEIRSVEALDGLIERARSEEVPLFVNFALPGLARLHFPKIMDRIENPDLFERVATLYGLEKQCTRLVYRLVK